MADKTKGKKFETKVKDNFKAQGFQYFTLYDVKWNIEVPKDVHDDLFERLCDDYEENYYENQEMEKDDYQQQLDDGEIADETEYINDKGEFGLLYQDDFEITPEIRELLEEQVVRAYADEQKLPNSVVLEFENVGNLSSSSVKELGKGIFLDKVKETYGVEAKDFKKVALSSDHQILGYTVEKNVSKMLDSNEFRKYLSLYDNFKNYNSYNISLVYAQKPDATMVKGAGAWDALGRHIIKGEKAIYIETATPPRKIEDQEKLDKYLENNTYLSDESKQKLRDDFAKDGFCWIRYLNWKSTPVFDISQTEGKELAPFQGYISMDMDNYDLIKGTLIDYMQSKGVEVVFEPISKADFSYNESLGKLSVRSDLSQQDTIKTLVEGMADALLHSKDIKLEGMRSNNPVPYNLQKLENCSVAFNVCEKLGISTDYAFQDMIKSFGTEMTANFGRSKEFSNLMNRVYCCIKNIENELDEKVLHKEKEDVKDDIDTKDEVDNR